MPLLCIFNQFIYIGIKEEIEIFLDFLTCGIRIKNHLLKLVAFELFYFLGKSELRHRLEIYCKAHVELAACEVVGHGILDAVDVGYPVVA